MFFKKDNNANEKYADIACWCTFVFWSGSLLINSIYEIFFDRLLISHSLTLLLSGLIVFFVTAILLKILKK